MAIISNSAGCRNFDPDFKKAERGEQALSISFIRHERKKPDVIDDILAHFGTWNTKEIAVIGDRIATDVLLGNLHGCMTILVEPFDPTKDNAAVKLARKIERSLWKFIIC